MTKKYSRIIAVIMLVIAIVFIFIALNVFVNKKVLQKGVKKVSTFNTQ